MAVVVAALLAAAITGCSPAASTGATASSETNATPSRLSTTVTPPPPVVDPRTPVEVATAFLTEFAGGNLQQACWLATSEVQRELGEQCDNTAVLERLPVLTLIDSCPIAPLNTSRFQVRFHVVPAVAEYQLPIRGEPQDLAVRVQGSGNSYDVYEKPSPTDPLVACSDGTA